MASTSSNPKYHGHMKLLICTLLAALLLPAQAPDLKSASGYVRAVQAQLRRNVERAAGKMPEESYAFRPSNDVRTFGELLGHIADTEYGFCAHHRRAESQQIRH